jgi:tetratricopeptide (TPR) repeat protein
MSTLYSFSQNLKSLNSEHKYSETLLSFKDQKRQFTIGEIGQNKFIVNDMMIALIETNNYSGFFSFLSIYQAKPDVRSFPYLLKRVKDKTTIPWDFVNKFCDLVDVIQLDTTCQKIEIERKGVKKEMELSSSQEEWYALKTKALFETGQYESCAELSKQALANLERFHYSYDVWFAHRIALCKKKTGKTTESLQELLFLLKKKKEWFIQSEIAGLYFELNDPENALKFAIEGMLNFGELAYKVGLITLIADILSKKGENLWAFKHYTLSKLLREQEEWNIPSSLTQNINSFDYQPIEGGKISQLTNELKLYWKKAFPERKKLETGSRQYTGRIAKIMHNDEKGIDGFIREGDEELYFRIKFDVSISILIKTGRRVQFEKKYSDKFLKMNAINLKIVD